MALTRLYARSSYLSSLYKTTLNSTLLKSRCLHEVGQRRYSFVGSEHSRRSYDKFPQLGIGHLKTPYYVAGSHHHYATNVIREQKSRKILYYLIGLVFAMVGCTYAAVPLYRRFCQATGYGGTIQCRETVEEKILRHAQDGTVTNREIVVRFNTDVSDGMP